MLNKDQRERVMLRHLGLLATEIEERETELTTLKNDRESTMKALVELRASRTPIMEA